MIDFCLFMVYESSKLEVQRKKLFCIGVPKRECWRLCYSDYREDEMRCIWVPCWSSLSEDIFNDRWVLNMGVDTPVGSPEGYGIVIIRSWIVLSPQFA